MILAISTTGSALLAALYVVLLLSLGITAIRKGHWVMFLVGIVFPLLWLVGALMPPTASSRAAAAG